jgi:Iap family predicted aminopeptidase
MEGDKKSIEYIENEFNKLGVKIERTPIRIPTYEDNGPKLVLTDTGTELECISPYFTHPTLHGGVNGEVVFIGKGTKEDYENIDVKGKIVVLNESGLGYSLFWLGTFSEIAAKRGAIGMIVIHPFPWPYRMSMEAGNSNLDNRFPKQQVPAVCISSIDGLKLMHHIGQGKTNAHLNVQSRIYDVDSFVLSGVIIGSEIPDERIAVLGHRDHGYPPGANDNLSGISNVLELARVFSNRKPRRSLEFICSTGEEGTTIGISEFIKFNKDRLNKLKAVIDLDMFDLIDVSFDIYFTRPIL